MPRRLSQHDQDLNAARDTVLDAYDEAITGMSERLRYDLLCNLVDTLTNCKYEIEELRAVRRYRKAQREAKHA